MSIRARLMMMLTICLSLACGSIVLFSFLSIRTASKDAFDALAASQLDRVEERINTFLEPGAMSIKYLAELELVRNSRGRLTSYLDTTKTTTLWYKNHPNYEQHIYDEFIRIHHSNDNYGLVFMANTDGQYAQAPEGHIKMAGYDPRQRSWYKEVMEDPKEVTITSPYLTTGGGMVCSIMVKTFDMAGEPLGLLGVDYSLQSLTMDLDQRRILQTGYLVIFDATGRIITDGHHPEYVNMEPQNYPELRKQIATASDGTFDGVGTRGIEEYIVTHTMAMTGWKLAVIFDRSEVFEASYALLRTTSIASLMIFLVAMVVLSMMARRIVRPIEALTQAATIISSGDYEHSESVRQGLQKKLDVTGEGESKQLATALRLTINTLQERIEAALAANRSKSDFLSNMSHEMRTPMNAIIGMTSIAKASDDAARKDYCLEKIEEASTHLLGVINDILDMSKIEANKFELSLAPFNLRETLQKAVDVIAFRVSEKNQRFTLSFDDALPDVLEGDDQRLTQVIMNLLSNAVKFTPEGGAIDLRALLDHEDGESCMVRIEVADNGIGISEEQQQRLFSSFEQADNGISRRFGGTGLGLSIAKRIVELMGGTIGLHSKVGEGSVFFFTMPAKRLPAQALIATPTANERHDLTKSLAGRHLLLVEDVEINREIVLSLLEGTQLCIDCAEDGKQAVALFSANPQRYDLILMDLQMPEMNGYDATRAIRALDDAHAQRIPILAMTANVFKEDIEKCLACGMNDHIGKPLDVVEVMTKLRHYLP